MKKIKLLILAIGAVLMFTACGDKVVVEETVVEGKEGVRREVAAEVQKPDSSQNESVDEIREKKPQINRPTMYGKVQKIVGNEVTLMLAKMPEPVQISKENREKISREEMKEKMKNRKIEFTGETVDIIIPVGVPIEKRGQGGASQVDLENIGVDSMLQVWVEDGDVVKVRIAR
ncbi:hypothetical protein [Anaeromicrobium sediminis]|uniref:Uncharacterized protein n=1 Tax=Anaeromicrobium sediminis TaxID=1478221 RepID=A0A267ME90_9FIRM|nr:hypothetical protein [Anaeromicrobium sediminis]PAB57238.1 hypothetical protein CCE28_19330 [Anaeromicrobium sediminis]